MCALYACALVTDNSPIQLYIGMKHMFADLQSCLVSDTLRNMYGKLLLQYLIDMNIHDANSYCIQHNEAQHIAYNTIYAITTYMHVWYNINDI